MDQDNPYASPAIADDRPSGTAKTCWRDNELLVMREDGILPQRCVYCNAPSQATFKFDVTSSFTFRIRSAILDLGICDSHRRQARRNLFIRSSVDLVGISMLLISFSLPLSRIGMLLFALFF